MKEYIIKFIIFTLISFAGGFLDAFLKDINIDFSDVIHFIIGYFTCLIFMN